MDRYYDRDGNDITDSVNQKIAAKEKELTDKFTADLTAKDTELSKLKEKDTNFETLKAGYETKFAELNTSLETMKTSVINDKKSEVMKRVTGGNKEIADKIEAELKALNLPMNNAEEVETAISKANAIVNQGQQPNPLHTATGAMGGKGNVEQPAFNPESETPEQKSMRQAFGITDDMAKKYGDPNFKAGQPTPEAPNS